MGRKKIQIARIESAYATKQTFKKRLAGLKKKAKELSILCDVPLLLLTVSPTDEFSLTMGPDCNFERMIQEFAQETPETRCKSLQETTNKLCNAYDKDEHVVDVGQLGHLHRSQPSLHNNEIEQKKAQHALVEEEISQLRRIMGPLGQLDQLGNIESMDTLVAIELALQNALDQNRLKMDEIVRHQMGTGWRPVQVPPLKEAYVTTMQLQGRHPDQVHDHFTPSSPQELHPLHEKSALPVQPLVGPVHIAGCGPD